MIAYSGDMFGSLGCHETFDFGENLGGSESLRIAETIMDEDTGRDARE